MDQYAEPYSTNDLFTTAQRYCILGTLVAAAAIYYGKKSLTKYGRPPSFTEAPIAVSSPQYQIRNSRRQAKPRVQEVVSKVEAPSMSLEEWAAGEGWSPVSTEPEQFETVYQSALSTPQFVSSNQAPVSDVVSKRSESAQDEIATPSSPDQAPESAPTTSPTPPPTPPASTTTTSNSPDQEPSTPFSQPRNQDTVPPFLSTPNASPVMTPVDSSIRVTRSSPESSVPSTPPQRSAISLNTIRRISSDSIAFNTRNESPEAWTPIAHRTRGARNRAGAGRTQQEAAVDLRAARRSVNVFEALKAIKSEGGEVMATKKHRRKRH